jgi:oligopeptide transport system permease protein
MVAFILRRFVSMLFVLFCVVSLTFCMVRLMKGGPFDKERKPPEAIKKAMLARFNLDGTLLQQYATYFGIRKNATGHYSGLLEGDLQPSLKYRSRTVKELLAQTLPVTMTLGLAAFIIATTFGVWLGSWAAVRHNTSIDTGAMLGALLAISIPTFVTGPLLILIFAIYLGWLPVGGWGGLACLVLPSITLAAPYVAYIARLMRSSMLEVLGQDFIRTARAKGLADTPVVYKHALKIAILPVVSYLGPLAANLLTGSLVVETVFNIPGAGVFFVSSIENRDGFLLCGVVMVYCALLVLLNLVVDVAYTLLDRRIKLYE